MSWLDAILDRAQEAKAKPTAAPPPLPTRKEPSRPYRAPTTARPAVPRRQRKEVKTVWIQTALPSGPDDPGAAEVGFYFVEADVVHMCDEAGKPTGESRTLSADDDPHRIAGRLKLAGWNKDRSSDFNRPLHYRAFGIA
ncbi:hypothetical protein [Bradyrhizobium diazoefficiens]|uniref:hypothetical protein n=1 Tax=Bradyrhizobium diazoefficiens TaxID=1355477 RepID=UPI003488C58F